MTYLIRSLGNLLRLRGGPQNFPSSWRVTVALLAVYILQNFITGQQLDDENTAAKSLVAISIQVIVLAALLYWRKFPERLPQTLSALASVGIVFNAITWTLLTYSNPALDQPTLAMTWLLVFIWSLFVDANIYRHALQVRLPIGMLIAVLALAISYAMIEMLFLSPSG